MASSRTSILCVLACASGMPTAMSIRAGLSANDTVARATTAPYTVSRGSSTCASGYTVSRGDQDECVAACEYFIATGLIVGLSGCVDDVGHYPNTYGAEWTATAYCVLLYKTNTGLPSHFNMDSINVRYDKWTYGQLCVSESVQATTPGPTLAPTLAPTAAPTVSSAGATGDPHLQNMFGQRFDLMKPGAHVLINIPRGVRAENALLRVEAEARRMGRGCADMYFQTLNVTGQWAEAGQERGYQYDALSGSKESPRWLTIGKVEIKVTHGQTESGIRYLNFYVKHLGQVGFAVGGLLGEDDFTDAASIPDGCKKMTSLHPGAVARASNSSSLSVAIAIVA